MAARTEGGLAPTILLGDRVRVLRNTQYAWGDYEGREFVVNNVWGYSMTVAGSFSSGQGFYVPDLEVVG